MNTWNWWMFWMNCKLISNRSRLGSKRFTWEKNSQLDRYDNLIYYSEIDEISYFVHKKYKTLKLLIIINVVTNWKHISILKLLWTTKILPILQVQNEKKWSQIIAYFVLWRRYVMFMLKKSNIFQIITDGRQPLWQIY